MKGHWRWLAGLSVLWLAGVAKLATADADPCTPPKQGASGGEAALSAEALSARIDAILDARLAAEKVKPAPLADDAEFMRRVYLDLAGKIPLASEVHDFLQNPAPNKRARLIWSSNPLDKSLLDSASYVNHFTNVWRALLLPPSNNQQVQVSLGDFEIWLRDRVRSNKPYDQLVLELLTTPLGSASPQMRNQAMDIEKVKPVAFYQANELKPENLAAATSRLFLGVKLECAQCHNHPHAQWTRNQFWEFAAFFSGIEARGPGGPAAGAYEAADRRSLKIPGTEKTVMARFLDGKEPQWRPEVRTRATLAQWIIAENNQYFARAAVNRLWAHFFGVGIVDPVDDLNDQNPPSHPELLDELARQFTLNHYDLKYLMRALTGSKAYQRSSAAPDPSQIDPRLFARMAVKGLSPEQLFDSLIQATAYSEDKTPANPRLNPVMTTPRAQFLARFANQEKRTEYHTSILQALALMNGKFIEDATSVEHSMTLLAVAESPFYKRGTPERIEELFLSTLSRMPTPEESERLVRYVDSGGPRHEQKAALADLFWALLNSAEFFLNH
jgi:hypothetical protein